LDVRKVREEGFEFGTGFLEFLFDLIEVRANFDEVKKELKEASAKFKPFLSDLSDIQKTVAMDVTAAGVKSVRSTVRSANSNHKSVDRAINSAIKELEKMAKSLSPEAK